MNPMRSVLSLGVLAGILVTCTGADTGNAGSPASQPAGSQMTDANYIGPTSWQRHFTIPKFVNTPRGVDLKMPTSRPADSAERDYYAARSTRSISTDSTSGSGSSSKSVGKSERSVRSSSKSESRRESRRDRSSSRRDRSSKRSRD